ncbi:MAG: hypothetical protein JWO15_1192 [Sphingomonadales bacterium]|nr:hypothetical protein [Sphingomonadales bacterium]
MIDSFSLGLTHALLLYAAWKLMARPDLDSEDTTKTDAKPRWGKR